MSKYIQFLAKIENCIPPIMRSPLINVKFNLQYMNMLNKSADLRKYNVLFYYSGNIIKQKLRN